uniref:Coat protein n=1 Tax=Plantago lanceolata latent virus TaxID=1830242 RepID=A0A166V5T9_9GEMI|nr:coat protein [Plantago lanceolata latent virus]
MVKRKRSTGVTTTYAKRSRVGSGYRRRWSRRRRIVRRKGVYARHRSQSVLHSLSNATATKGKAGYGWHLNEIPLGSSYTERHSDKVKVKSFRFRMQFRDGANGGTNAANVHNLYLYLVKDNSGGTEVPSFDKIAMMDYGNVATAIIDHDSEKRFTIVRQWKYTFTGSCNSQYPGKDRIDFNDVVYINVDTEFKSATDGKYANTQKNAWVLYIIPQSYDCVIDGHVNVRFESLV